MERRGARGDGGAPRAEIAQGDGCEVNNHAAGGGNRRDEVQTEVDAEEQVHDQIAARNSVSVSGLKPAARTRQRAAPYLRVQGSVKSVALSSSLPPPKPMMMRAGRKMKV